MMKRKFLAVVLPIIGCATVVGSGFSAWYFGAAASVGDGEGINIGTSVTEEINSVAGTLSIDESNASTINGMNLILDQGGFENTNNQGIMFYEGTPSVVMKNDLKYSFNVKFTGTETLDLQDVYNANMELKVTVSFNLGNVLSQYIAVKSGAGMKVEDGPAGDEGELKFTKGEGNDYTATYTLKKDSLDEIVDLENAVFTFSIDLSTNDSFENSLFVYAEGRKPTDTGTLTKMKNDLTGPTGPKITFSTVATIK